MHSVDKRLTVDVAEVIDSLLFVHKTLFPGESWISVRLHFLEQAPESELGAHEFSRNRVCWEIELAINILKPSNVKKYFGIDKNKGVICALNVYRKRTEMPVLSINLAYFSPKSLRRKNYIVPYVIRRIVL